MVAQELVLISVCDMGYQYGSTGTCVDKCVTWAISMVAQEHVLVSVCDMGY